MAKVLISISELIDGNGNNTNDYVFSATDVLMSDRVTNVNDAINGKAPSSHNHSASNITSGTLGVARGGTGITSNPSMLTNLASTSAASVFAASPRPGVTGTLPIANGGTGATSASAARTALGAAASSHTHSGTQVTGLTASRALMSNSSGQVAVSSITSTELGYLDGVTSNIQTQLNGKAASSHTHTGTQITGLTANRALVSNSSGQLAVSAVTSTELGYLDGVTSNIQTQLNGKATSSHTHNYAGSSSAGGSATSAVKLATARSISLSGDASGSASFDGSKNISIAATVVNHGTTSIPADTNMNSYTDPGWYYCPANATVATLTNCPTDKAFTLIVTQHAGRNQLLIEYMTVSPRIFTRNFYNNSWGSWYEIYHTGQKPTASEIGAAASSHTHSGTQVTGLTASRALVSNSSGQLAVSAVTSTELGYLDGVTSNVQTQLNRKAASSHNHSASNITSGTLGVARGGTGVTANPSMLTNLASTSAASVFATSPRPGVTGTLPIANGGTGATSASAARTALGAAASSHTHSGTQVTGLTASRALVSNSSGQVSVSAVTSTELGYLDGVTSSVQTQLNGKPGKIITTNGNIGEIFNDYTNNIASGDLSHAEGRQTTASKDWSHAEGANTKASGICSHAEGNTTEASGAYGSHAEGNATIASGEYGSHAEGTQTEASGVSSHAEGNTTEASGQCSHAEGVQTTASGSYSHAEGRNTEASGDISHAEGFGTTASGSYSHAEGSNTTASGSYSHAEGSATTASVDWSHAEGVKTTSSGYASHAEGYNTTASANYSHSEGYYTTASGDFSHAEGNNTIASSNYQHVQGKYNIKDTSGKYAHIVGWGTSDAKRKNIFTITTAGAGKFASSCTATSHPTSSSRRFKENFREVPEEEINKILSLNATKFDFKEEYGGMKDRVGFIAEDMAEIYPNCVSYDEEGEVAGIDYSSFVPYMIEMIKKQQEEIEELKGQLSDLLSK